MVRPALVTAAAVLAALAPPAAAAPPTVTGPIPATAAPGDPSHDYPFFASDDRLARDGYVEREYFIEGTATRYAADGSELGSAPYKTRIVVRRPQTPRRFNGTVIVEWYNVSNQYDQEVDWIQSHEHFTRAGYAWVGVSAQRAGVHSPLGLRAWNPDRYGSLDLTAGGTVLDDSLSYDVFTQAAQAILESRGAAPLGNLRADQVLATGHSQSAARLRTYHNAVHPKAGVYDGFVLHGLFGPETVQTQPGTPVFKLQSESDVLQLGQAATRQPDTKWLRTWEVAGTSHGDWKLVSEHGPLRIRDIGSPPEDYPVPSGRCANPPFSRIPWHMAQNKAYDALAAWAKHGRQPARAPLIELTSVQPAVAARDADGNALGGLRLPNFEVPTALNSGVNSGPPGTFCFLHGHHAPFSPQRLRELYPTRLSYPLKLAKATAESLLRGHITVADALTVGRY